MRLERWNYKTREYEPYEVPDGRRVRGLCWNLTELIDCAACGREIEFGSAFTSHEIQSKSGLGYGVCPECYEEERRRYLNGND